MFKFFQKTKGAISVFLVIIMLPVMLFGWIMIDMSRKELARARIAEATDLTLNTALAEYDNILKELYGIFATSQTSDEMFSSLEDYYSRNLMVAGMDEESASNLSENIIYKLTHLNDSGEDYSYADFLSSDLIELSVGLNQNATLINPEILKEQIVDFMKYRAPLGVGLQLVDLIKSFKTVKEQTQIIEDKTAYYEAQADVEQCLANAWGNIEKYNEIYIESGKLGTDERSEIRAAESIVEKLVNSEKSENTLYFLIPYAIVREMILLQPSSSPDSYGSPFGSFSENIHRLSQNGNMYCLEECNHDPYTNRSTPYKNELSLNIQKVYGKHASTPMIEDEDGDEREDTAEIATRQKDYYKKRNVYEEAKKKYLDDVDSQSRNRKYSFRYVMNIAANGNNTVTDLNLYAYAVSMMYYYPTVFWDKSFKDYFEAYDEMVQSAMEVPSDYFSDEDYLYAEHDTFVEEFSSMKQFTEKMLNFRDHWSVQYSISANNKAEELFSKLSTLKKDLNSARVYLSAAHDFLGNALTLIESELNNARKAWKDSSENSNIAGSTFSDSNLAEINNVEEKFDKKQITDLRNLVMTKINTIDNLLLQLSELTFCDAQLSEITNLYDYYNIYKQQDSRLKNNPVNGWERTFRTAELDDLFLQGVDGVISKFKVDSGFTYTQAPNQDGNLEFVTTIPLYRYMSKVYNGMGTSIKSDGKEEDDSETQKSKSKMKETIKSVSKTDLNKTDSGTEITPYKGQKINSSDAKLPSVIKAESAVPAIADVETGKYDDSEDADWKEASKAVQGSSGAAETLFGSILKLLEEAAETFRDDLYIEEYIMGMFSYQTMEKELMAQQYNLGNSLLSQLSYADFAFYKKIYASEDKDEYVFESATEEKYGLSSTDYNKLTKLGFTKDNALKKLETLTNIPISPDNNYAYLNEVEYIIYGNNGTDKTKTVIAAIRFILDTISAFMNNELSVMAQSIALAVFGTPPLTFLVPVAKIAIIIACAIAEAAIDVKLIYAGQKVAVFKNQDTWMVSPSGLAKQAGEVLVDLAKKEINSAISQAKTTINNIINDLNIKADAKIEDYEDTIVDSLGTAYDSSIGTFISDVTGSLVMACDTCIDMAYRAALDTNGKLEKTTDDMVNDVISRLESMMMFNNMDKTSVEYKVKNMVFNYICTEGNAKKLISPILEQMDISKTIKSTGDKYTDAIREVPEKIKSAFITEADGAVTYVGDQIKQLKNEATDKAKGLISKGADSLENSANEFLDSILDSSKNSSTQDAEALSSGEGMKFELGYSGYLRIMLMIGLVANQSSILCRTADVMQLNMQKITGNSSYVLSKSYAYLDLKVKTRINPLFFSFEGLERYLGIDSYSENSSEKLAISRLYEITYSQRAGY